MQTFLPYRDIKKSISILDNKRLGKQRVEAKQLLDLLLGVKKNNWINHPACRMWKGYENYLKLYYNLCIDEWVNRGFKNNMSRMEIIGECIKPHWFKDDRVFLSHKCNLLRKDISYYGKYWGRNILDIDAPYFWPVELKTKKKNEEMLNYWSKK